MYYIIINNMFDFFDIYINDAMSIDTFLKHMTNSVALI